MGSSGSSWSLRQAGLNGQQFGRAAGQPVGFGDGQHVALAHEGETLGELHPLGDALACSPKGAASGAPNRFTMLVRWYGGSVTHASTLSSYLARAYGAPK
jgi:hypothetical protein